MKYIFFVVIILIVREGFGQNKNELSFIDHLINKGYFSEAIYLIDRDSLNYTIEQRDSLNYYMGWANYSLKKLELSTVSLLNVGEESSFYLKSRFFAGYNQIFIEDYSEATRILEMTNIGNEPHLSLLNFELSGIEMLKGNWLKANEQLKLVNPEIPTINQQLYELQKICKNKESHRSRSPLLAGVRGKFMLGELVRELPR